MDITRRSFLKITGATTIMAAIPVVALDELIPELANSSTVTITNLDPGFRVGILDAMTNEVLFNGVSEGDTVTTEISSTEPTEIVVVIRHPSMKSFRTHLLIDGRNDLTLPVVMMKDELYG